MDERTIARSLAASPALDGVASLKLQAVVKEKILESVRLLFPSGIASVTPASLIRGHLL